MNVSEPRICYQDFQLQFPVRSQQTDPDYYPFNINNPIGADNEKISAFAACERFIACGTFSGRVFIYTYGEEHPKAEFKMQNHRITGLSFNNNCTLLLASSFDSKISFIDLNEFRISFSYTHNIYILDCSIDPESRIGGPYSCVFIDSTAKGEQNKVIRLKPPNKFFNKKEIAEEMTGNEPGLDKIVWQGDIVAWSSLKHFTIMNMKSGQNVTSPQKSSYLDSSKTSFLFTPNNESLTVFFKGNLYDVTLSPKLVIQQPRSSPKKNVIIMTRTADFDARLIQQVDRNAEPKIEFQTPKECYDDFVPYDSFDPTEFLQLTPGARDIILALPYKVIGITRAKLSEIIDVYLNSNCIEPCINKFRDSESSIDNTDRSVLFKKIIHHLLANNDIDRCIGFCEEFAKPDDWEEIIKCFEGANCLKAIAPKVQIKESNLSKEDVTKILRCLALECNAEAFSEKFTNLQPNRYDANALIGDISRQAEKDPELTKYLIILQHSTENHHKALQNILEIKQTNFFVDVETFALYDFVKKNFLKVLQTYPNLLPDFLMRHLTELPPAKMLKKANKFLNQANKDRNTNLVNLIEKFKLSYLDKLYNNNNPIINNEEFGTELASLYIRNGDEEKAMKFLSSTTNYRLMGICKEAENYKMFQVAAFLYYTAGNKKKGMEIHLNQLKNPHKSLEYAKMCEDKDVWNLISEHAYKHKDYLECMLADLPNLNIKMKEFISKIPPDMHIENFEDLARRSLNEYQRKLRTAQIAYEIVSKDAFGAFKRSFNTYKNGKKTQF